MGLGWFWDVLGSCRFCTAFSLQFCLLVSFSCQLQESLKQLTSLMDSMPDECDPLSTAPGYNLAKRSKESKNL